MQLMSNNPRFRVLLYLVLTVTFSSIFYVLCIRHGMKMKYVFPLMWSPGVAGLLTSLATRRSFKEFGWGLGKLKYLAAGWWVPLAYAIPAYLVVWTTRLGGFPNQQTLDTMRKAMLRPDAPSALLLVFYFVIIVTIGVVFSCLSAAGEEIGWRGFLVPELMKFNSFTGTALASGIIWSLWHVPLIVWGNYNSGTPAWYSVTCFAVMVLSISFVFAWLRMRSNSLWPAVLLHATHNAVIQQFLDPITSQRGHTNYFIGEFGCAMLPFTIFAAWWVWKHRAEVEKGIATSATV